MQELLKEVLAGWDTYKEQGKLSALLLCALLYLWFRALHNKKKENPTLLLYTSLMTFCCICPITAALLTVYQRQYYNYVWIWSMVPITTVIAWAGSVFLWDCEKQQGKEGRGRLVAIGGFVVAIIFLSGNVGLGSRDISMAGQERQEAYAVLSELADTGNNTDICLWAPRIIMEHARAYAGDIILPYGRNMWDSMLGTYSYDSYSPETQQLYDWMQEVERGKVPKDMSCVTYALEKGVNYILLPPEADEGLRNSLEKRLGVQARELAHYYAFVL